MQIESLIFNLQIFCEPRGALSDVGWAKSCGLKSAFLDLPLKVRMEEIRGQDGECAEVEGGVEGFVFLEEECGGEDAVDGLEVEGEVHGVGGDGAEEVDVEGVGENGADPGEEKYPEPVGAGRCQQGGEACGIEKREGRKNHRTRADHFPADHRERIPAPRDNGAVQDGENGCEERAQQRHAETEQVSALDPGDEQDAGHDNQAEQHLEGPDSAAREKRLGEGSEERDRGKPCEADGDVRELDGAEKAQPVEPDDGSDGDQRSDRSRAGPDLVFPDKRDPEERAQCGEDRAPRYQHRSADARKPPKDRGGGEQKNQKVELEERADVDWIFLRETSFREAQTIMSGICFLSREGSIRGCNF